MEKIELTPVSEAYIEPIQKYLGNKKIAATYPIPHPYPSGAAKRFVLYEIASYKQQTRYAFAILYKQQFSGICALSKVNYEKRSAQIYYWIAVPFWGKGIATAALHQLLDFSKEKLKLTTLYTGVLVRNPQSRRVLEKNGFKYMNTIINNGEYNLKFNGEHIVEMSADLKDINTTKLHKPKSIILK